jgi:hypothetical protein
LKSLSDAYGHPFGPSVRIDKRRNGLI